MRNFLWHLRDLLGKSPVDASLYLRHPTLLRIDLWTPHREAIRAGFIDQVPKGGVGAELGVFCGNFSRTLIRRARPSTLYLVDPWWTVFGEDYPDWQGYTDHGRLKTAVAHEAAVKRVGSVAAPGTETAFVVDTAANWLRSMPDASLDWAYLDASHEYHATIEELTLLVAKVKPGGLILGDDYQDAFGVKPAVDYFASAQNLPLSTDTAQQFAIRNTPILAAAA